MKITINIATAANDRMFDASFIFCDFVNSVTIITIVVAIKAYETGLYFLARVVEMHGFSCFKEQFSCSMASSISSHSGGVYITSSQGV